MMGVLMYNIRCCTELEYLVILVTSVTSSVLGLLVITNMISSYGSDMVAF